MCVLTKIEGISETELMEKQAIVREHATLNPWVYPHENIGLAELQDATLTQLFGSPTSLQLTYSEVGRILRDIFLMYMIQA